MIKLRSLIEIKKSMSSRLGKCYQLAGEYVYGHPNAILVHGELTNRFAQGLPRLDHAWIEDGNEIFDPVMDMKWPKEVYEGLFKTKVFKKYSHREAIEMIDKHMTWGPWHE